nr:CD2-associated protein-like [Ciona intestinalis]|eukprot:XP_002128571.1 CD2-associated protein-like [Ciona intestinalis]
MWKETTSPALSPVDTEDKSILEVAAMKVDKDKKVQIDVGMKKYITGEMYYVATVDYTPTNFTDLSFSCGEKITVMKRIDEELLFGRNEEGEEGPFPEKFVKLESNSDNENNSNSVAIMNHYNTNQSNNIIFDVDKAMGMHLPTPFEFTQDKHVSTTDTNCVRAKYDFVAKNEDELSVKAGDKLELISRVDSDWVKAKCEGILGILPVNFVNHDCSQLPLEQSIADTNNINLHCKQLPSEVNTTAVARYSFTGQDDTELTFHQNDVIHILGSINEEWLQGSLNGKKGIFPSNFVAMS